MRERAGVHYDHDDDTRDHRAAAFDDDAEHDDALLIRSSRDDRRARARVPLFLLRFFRLFGRFRGLDFLFFRLAYHWRNRLQFFAFAQIH